MEVLAIHWLPLHHCPARYERIVENTILAQERKRRNLPTGPNPRDEMASSSRRTGGKESFYLRKKFEPHFLRDSEMPRSPPPNPSASRLAFTADPQPRLQEVLSKMPSSWAQM